MTLKALTRKSSGFVCIGPLGSYHRILGYFLVPSWGDEKSLTDFRSEFTREKVWLRGMAGEDGSLQSYDCFSGQGFLSMGQARPENFSEKSGYVLLRSCRFTKKVLGDLLLW